MQYKILKNGGYIGMPKNYPFVVDVDEQDIIDGGIDVPIERLIERGASDLIGWTGDKLYFCVPGEAEPFDELRQAFNGATK